MKTFSLKNIIITVASTLIVSGLAYAATTITSLNQTVATDDVISAAWFNDVKNRMTALETKVNNIPTPDPQKWDIIFVKQIEFSTKEEYKSAIYNAWLPVSQANAVQQSEYCSTSTWTSNTECLAHACRWANVLNTFSAQKFNWCEDNIYWNTQDPAVAAMCAWKKWIGISCSTK